MRTHPPPPHPSRDKTRANAVVPSIWQRSRPPKTRDRRPLHHYVICLMGSDTDIALKLKKIILLISEGTDVMTFISNYFLTQTHRGLIFGCNRNKMKSDLKDIKFCILRHSYTLLNM